MYRNLSEVFEMFDDGLAYVKLSIKTMGSTALLGDDGKPQHNGIHEDGIVEVLPDLEDAVQEAMGECPGECIFIEK